MNRLVFILVAASMVFAPLPAAAELPQVMAQAFEQYSALPDLLTPILSEVKDKESADAAAPKLHDVLDDIAAARDALETTSGITPEQKAEAQKRYGRRMREQWGKLFTEIFRLNRVQCYRSSALATEFGNMNMLLSQ